MEHLKILKTKIITEIDACSDENQLQKIWSILNSENKVLVAEPQSKYESEKQMTEPEVEEYFKDETIVLPHEILDRLKISEKQIENGEFYTNDEVEKYFEEWLED